MLRLAIFVLILVCTNGSAEHESHSRPRAEQTFEQAAVNDLIVRLLPVDEYNADDPMHMEEVDTLLSMIPEVPVQLDSDEQRTALREALLRCGNQFASLYEQLDMLIQDGERDFAHENENRKALLQKCMVFAAGLGSQEAVDQARVLLDSFLANPIQARQDMLLDSLEILVAYGESEYFSDETDSDEVRDEICNLVKKMMGFVKKHPTLWRVEDEVEEYTQRISRVGRK